MKTIIVYRFSAMGDVAMLLPVLKGIIKANTDLQLVLVTKPFYANFFHNIEGLQVYTPDFKDKHKGLFGIYRLFKELNSNFDPIEVFDLHDVLRTKVLNLFFRLSGKRVFKYTKGRKEKKKAIRSKETKTSLKTTHERYIEPFKIAGYHFEECDYPLFEFFKSDSILSTHLSANKHTSTFSIGIAPFAKHKQKIWPFEYISELITLINANYSCTLFLFGGGKNELDKLETLTNTFANCIIASSAHTIKEEIQLIAELDCMICMDSSNMHLAALAGTEVFSIWGATHPSIGFSPYKGKQQNYIQPIDQFSCRPCSVYGNKKCIYQTVRCIESISPQMVFDKIASYLNKTITE